MTTLTKILVTFPELKELGIRYSRQHISRLMAEGKFPKPIRLGSNDMSTRSHWRLVDILKWIEERATASGLPQVNLTVGFEIESPVKPGLSLAHIR
jgi:predicted DNA-binding transcriptional regulator AlpA